VAREDSTKTRGGGEGRGQKREVVKNEKMSPAVSSIWKTQRQHWKKFGANGVDRAIGEVSCEVAIQPRHKVPVQVGGTSFSKGRNSGP